MRPPLRDILSQGPHRVAVQAQDPDPGLPRAQRQCEDRLDAHGDGGGAELGPASAQGADVVDQDGTALGVRVHDGSLAEGEFEVVDGARPSVEGTGDARGVGGRHQREGRTVDGQERDAPRHNVVSDGDS